jgi:hypothetical protein
MSYHFSIFLYFTPLYISLTYDVFLNKDLHVFNNYSPTHNNLIGFLLVWLKGTFLTIVFLFEKGWCFVFQNTLPASLFSEVAGRHLPDMGGAKTIIIVKTSRSTHSLFWSKENFEY